MAKHWLLKTEPSEYSITTLKSEGTGTWDGIRNYQARNFIREMKDGDHAFLYHSSCKSPGIYGLMRIAGSAHPDGKALDKSSKYHDSKATAEANPWSAVDVQFVAEFTVPLLLPDIKSLELGPCPLTARGNRLWVIPLTEAQFELLNSELQRLNQ